MTARRAGLLLVGLMFGAGGAATLLRAGYLSIPAWRRGIAWGCVAIGVACVLAAWSRRLR